MEVLINALEKEKLDKETACGAEIKGYQIQGPHTQKHNCEIRRISTINLAWEFQFQCGLSCLWNTQPPSEPPCTYALRQCGPTRG